MSHYFSEANLRYNPLLYLFGCNSNVFPINVSFVIVRLIDQKQFVNSGVKTFRELTTGGAVISSIALLGAVLGMGPTVLSVPLIGRSSVSSPPGVVSRQQDLPLPKRQRLARPGVSKYKNARYM